MADRAVLAHDVLVLKDDPRAGAIVRAGIRAADQVDHLVGLDAAGARIDRIRPDTGKIVDLERRDAAVLVDADPCFDAVIARMESVTKLSSRSATNLTGRLSSFDSATVAI